MKNKRVLVISHNAFSTTNNMGKTLKALFNTFDKSNLAQLYFHSANSDVDMCRTSFRITDKDIVKSIYMRNKCGTHINKENIKGVNTKGNNIVNKIGQKRNATKHLIRDFVWKIGSWKTAELISWIEEFKPEVIFYASGYAMFSFDIAIYISKKFNIPLITYFCDDYYDFDYRKGSNKLIAQIRLKLFRNKIREIVEQSTELIFISETMMAKYKDLFNKEGKVLMTPYSFSINEPKECGKIITISYLGSVQSNRWMVLRKIGEALDKINNDGIKIILDIYSMLDDEYVKSRLSMNKSMNFKGEVSSEQVKEVYKNSDVLLHVESFLEADIVRVKHSLSTKVADCLASNRAFLVVASNNLASVKYLKDNNAAYIIDNEEKILELLRKYFIDNSINNNIINNAKTLANKNHSSINNANAMRNIINNLK